MKYFVGFLLAILLAAGYLITNADKVSESYTKWYETNKTEAEYEKYAYYAIFYTNAMGKYKTSLELCNKFLEKYDRYDTYEGKTDAEKRIDLVNFYKADNLDRMMDTYGCKDAYNYYLQKFPNGEKVTRVNERKRELNFN